MKGIFWLALPTVLLTGCSLILPARTFSGDERFKARAEKASDAAAVASQGLSDCAVEYALEHRQTRLSGSEIGQAAVSACEQYVSEARDQFTIARFNSMLYVGTPISEVQALRFGETMKEKAISDAANAVLRALAEADSTPTKKRQPTTSEVLS